MHRMKKILAGFLVFLALLCMVLGAAIVTFKITGLRFCTVDGHSMDNTLFDGEQLLLNPSAEIRSGDIVVFEYGQTYLIKRVVGLPGDTVAVVKGVLYVNNIKYDESYLSEECITRFMDSSFMVTVGRTNILLWAITGTTAVTAAVSDACPGTLSPVSQYGTFNGCRNF